VYECCCARSSASSRLRSRAIARVIRVSAKALSKSAIARSRATIPKVIFTVEQVSQSRDIYIYARHVKDAIGTIPNRARQFETGIQWVFARTGLSAGTSRARSWPTAKVKSIPGLLRAPGVQPAAHVQPRRQSG
jgi:hypothetical protein